MFLTLCLESVAAKYNLKIDISLSEIKVFFSICCNHKVDEPQHILLLYVECGAVCIPQLTYKCDPHGESCAIHTEILQNIVSHETQNGEARSITCMIDLQKDSQSFTYHLKTEQYAAPTEDQTIINKCFVCIGLDYITDYYELILY